MDKEPIILGIESSCDDTSAAVLVGHKLLSNVIASQAVHTAYGGVVPELASRAHEQNIVPVVSEAIRRAGITAHDIDAIAFTRGPGLLGSLLVGTNFAKGLSLSLGIPMVEVNHLHAHVLAHFIEEDGLKTSFLYTLRDELEKNPNFIEERKADLCASLQATVIDILMKKLRAAAKDLGIRQVAVAGGVSANTGLREAFHDHARRYGWKVFIPKFAYTTDNAAMVAMNGYFSFVEGKRTELDAVPFARVTM